MNPSFSAEIMWKSMFIDLKEECKLCGMPVGIYLVNYDQGLKMCSNKRCEWPITEEEMEIFSFGDMQFKSTNIEGPCTDVDLKEIKKLSMCIRGPSKPKLISSITKTLKEKSTKMIDKEKSNKQSSANINNQENKVNLGKLENGEKEDSNHDFVVNETHLEVIDSLENIIEYDGEQKLISKESEDIKKQERDEVDVNLEILAMEIDPEEAKEGAKDIFEKPLPIDDELHIDKCLEKARAKIASAAPIKSKMNTTNPWMLKRLYINQSSKTKGIKRLIVPHESLREKIQIYDDEIIREPTTEIPKIHVKINTDSSSGPAITIQFDAVGTDSGSSINPELSRNN